MSDQPAKIIDAEVVSRPGPAPAERVKVSRLPTGMLLRGVRSDDPEGMQKRLREVRFRLWLWLAGFALIAGACFIGAATTQTIIWSAFLLVAGLACACASSVVWLLIWAIRRIR